MNGGHDRAYPLRVDPGVRGLQIDPFMHPDLPAFTGGKHAALGGAPYLRRRYASGAGRFLERRRRGHLASPDG